MNLQQLIYMMERQNLADKQELNKTSFTPNQIMQIQNQNDQLLQQNVIDALDSYEKTGKDPQDVIDALDIFSKNAMNPALKKSIGPIKDRVFDQINFNNERIKIREQILKLDPSLVKNHDFITKHMTEQYFSPTEIKDYFDKINQTKDQSSDNQIYSDAIKLLASNKNLTRADLAQTALDVSTKTGIAFDDVSKSFSNIFFNSSDLADERELYKQFRETVNEENMNQYMQLNMRLRSATDSMKNTIQNYSREGEAVSNYAGKISQEVAGLDELTPTDKTKSSLSQYADIYKKAVNNIYHLTFSNNVDLKSFYSDPANKELSGSGQGVMAEDNFMALTNPSSPNHRAVLKEVRDKFTPFFLEKASPTGSSWKEQKNNADVLLWEQNFKIIDDIIKTGVSWAKEGDNIVIPDDKFKEMIEVYQQSDEVEGDVTGGVISPYNKETQDAIGKVKRNKDLLKNTQQMMGPE